MSVLLKVIIFTYTIVTIIETLSVVGSRPYTFPKFVPPITTGHPYIISPNNLNLLVKGQSGNLEISGLGYLDAGIYTIATLDHQGANVTIEVIVLGTSELKLMTILSIFFRPSICHWY